MIKVRNSELLQIEQRFHLYCNEKYIEFRNSN